KKENRVAQDRRKEIKNEHDCIQQQSNGKSHQSNWPYNNEDNRLQEQDIEEENLQEDIEEDNQQEQDVD
ncbi:24474_t:CDS:2, partial [Entrophospora sp. SA101]